MKYIEIIKDSLNTCWRHEALWVFGMILTLVGQGDFSFSVEYQERYHYPSTPGEMPDLPTPIDNPLFTNFFENPIPYIIGFTILGLVFWIFSNFIGCFSRGALIKMVDEIEQTGTTSVRRGWELGKHEVKSLFALAVVFAVPQLIILLPATISGLVIILQMISVFGQVFSAGAIPSVEEMNARVTSILPTLFTGLACFFPTICIGGIINAAIKLVNKIAARSCVLENLGVMDSVKRGWYITRRNIGYTCLNWLVWAATSGILGLVAAIPALLFWVPAAKAFLHNDWSATSIVAGLVTGLYFVLVGIIFGGILSSFNSTLWTKLYKWFLARENSALSTPGFG